MTERTTRAGIGELTLEQGPDGMQLWRAADRMVARLYDDPVVVTILLEGDTSLDRAPLHLIAEVLADLEAHLVRALKFVQAQVAADPVSFELQPDEALRLAALSPEQFPLAGPELTFYADHEWLLRFAEGGLPTCDPFGVAIAFDGPTPTRIEDPRDSEPITSDHDGESRA